MAVVLALTAALVYGVSDYCGGRATRSAPVLAVTLVTQAATVAVAIVPVALLGDPFPPAADIAWSMAAGLMSITAIVAFYFALANGAMTVVAPVTAVVSALLPVVVGVGQGERPSVLALVGVSVALMAVALISGVGGRAERPTEHRIMAMAVVAGAGFGLLFVFLDRTSDESGFWPLLIGQLTSLPLVVAAVLIWRVSLPPPRSAAGLALFAGSFGVLANVCYLAATRRGLLSLVAVITSMYPASTVGLATLLDRERLTTSQLVGLGLAVVALGMVTASA